MKRLAALAVAACALVVAGCFIGAGSFAGKGCDTNNECPDPYTCVQVRPGGRTCELVHGLSGGSRGTGGGSGAGGGPVLNPDYCDDVKPILDRTCLVNCHGVAMDYPGTRKDFRLDYYVLDGGLPGAKVKAVAIKGRVVDDSMPPSGPSPRPTSAERSLILKWVNTGAGECNDAGGKGGVLDGGSDGGKTDGGDGG